VSKLLDELFPPLPPEERRQIKPGHNPILDANLTMHEGKPQVDHVSTRWASICTMELQGLDKKEIADRIGMHYNTIINITNDPRYIEYRDDRLRQTDDAFIRMKPLAVAALRNGLTSSDENTALRASEQWFKGAGFGGFSRVPESPTQVTAEDVAAAIVNNLQVNVQVNVKK
jgi:hypothetical protein